MREDWSVDQDPAAYPATERALWRRLYRRQYELAERHTCPEFRQALARLDCADDIPDFAQASRRLQNASGWRLVAVPGLVPDDVFFRLLDQMPMLPIGKIDRAELKRKASQLP